MTLQQLEYIVALDEERHFQRAAERCHVTQPTLSMQVQKLEDTLGLLIFDRKAHPLQPTPVGVEVIQRARRVLAEARELQASVRALSSWQVGEYRLGIIPTLASSLLPRFLGKFLETHPGLRLTVEELQTSALVERLKANQLDAALLAGPLGEGELTEVPLLYEPFWVFAAFDHPLAECPIVTPERLDPQGLWLLNQGHCLRAQMLNLCQLRAEANHGRFAFESGSIETLKTMVRKQGGYTLVPALSLDAQAEDTAVYRPFSVPTPARSIVLAAHHSYARKGFLKALGQAVAESVPVEMHSSENKTPIGIG